MNIEQLSIADVLLIHPKRFGDDRGFFSETYRKSALQDAGFDAEFLQDNHSMSAKRGTVRGLHFQLEPHAQSKLIRVIHGSIFDVAVDLRAGSPTFGAHVSAELSAENGRQLLAPKGFAHGFQTLTDECEVLYKVTDYYAPASERGLLWSDPELGIQWPIPKAEAVINARDADWPTLANIAPLDQ